MKQQWEKLEVWLNIHEPALQTDLNLPASDADIQILEKNLGVSLPADFVGCLKVHNGQLGRSGGLFDGKEFLSCRNILMSWSAWSDLLEEGDFDGKTSKPAAGIKLGWWVKGWIPFATNGSGDFLCIDLSPSAKGNSGQVIKVFHDAPDRVVEAVCFSAWFDHFVGSKHAKL